LTGERDDASDAGDTTLTNKSDLSFLSDEGLEVSQHVVTDSLFQGPSLDEQGEELVIDSGSKLKTAVDKLLEMVAILTRQVSQSRFITKPYPLFKFPQALLKLANSLLKSVP
jgi:hypothetical protein